MIVKILLGCAVYAAVSFNAFGQEEDKKGGVSYQNDVYPILHDYCLSCHSPGGRGYNKSGLDMNSYETLMKGTRFGAVVKAGDPETSTVVMLVEGRARPELHMPPLNGKLYREHITILRKWVHQGARNN